VTCYSNCDEVELWLNGASLGRQTMPRNGHLTWADVIYTPGVLEAHGYRDGQPVASTRVETTGAPYALHLSADRTTLRADRQDVAVVAVAVVDRVGRVVPTADNEVSFHLEGPGTILGVGNGNPSSHEPDKGSLRRAFNGLAQVILRAGATSGPLVLTARAPGLRSAQIAIEALCP
jgi:beta-galactosidase